eukprot:TRINITY_DN3963_c0_g1_i6.p1 TRINITY_DN3963_c0_g1~~TRINITY_DN3963_c0_g1_i6.p1  ORF type:complete len:1273 (-),score=248.34 TRINITY_DN3963_c0_g1_i6:538-4356(-)
MSQKQSSLPPIYSSVQQSNSSQNDMSPQTPQPPMSSKTPLKPSPRFRDVSHLRDSPRKGYHSAPSLSEYTPTSLENVKEMSPLPLPTKGPKKPNLEIDIRADMFSEFYIRQEEGPETGATNRHRRSWIDISSQEFHPLSRLTSEADTNIIQTVQKLCDYLHAVVKVPSNAAIMASPQSARPHTVTLDGLNTPRTHPLLQVPHSIFPKKYSVLETSPFLRPSDDPSITRINSKTKQVERVMFPSSYPSNRVDVVHLSDALLHMMQDIEGSIQERNKLAARGMFGCTEPEIHQFINQIQLEAQVWDSTLSEVVRQVHIHCTERAVLLEQVRVRMIDLIAIMLGFFSRFKKVEEGDLDARSRFDESDNLRKELHELHAKYLEQQSSFQTMKDEIENQLRKRSSENWFQKERIDYLENRLADMLVKSGVDAVSEIQDKALAQELTGSPTDLRRLSILQKRRDSTRKLSVVSQKSSKPILELQMEVQKPPVYDASADIEIADTVISATEELDAHLLRFFYASSSEEFQTLTELFQSVIRRKQSCFAHQIDVKDLEKDLVNEDELDENTSEIGLKLLEIRDKIKKLMKYHTKLMQMDEDAEKSAAPASASTTSETQARFLAAIKYRTTWLRSKLKSTQSELEESRRDLAATKHHLERIRKDVDAIKSGSIMPRLAREVRIWKTKYETLQSHFENDSEKMQAVYKLIEAATKASSVPIEKEFWNFLGIGDDVVHKTEDEIYDEYSHLMKNNETGLENEFWESQPNSAVASPVPMTDTEGSPADPKSLAGKSLNKDFDELEDAHDSSSQIESQVSDHAGVADFNMMGNQNMVDKTERFLATFPSHLIRPELVLPDHDFESRLETPLLVNARNWDAIIREIDPNIKTWMSVQVEYTSLPEKIEVLLDFCLDIKVDQDRSKSTTGESAPYDLDDDEARQGVLAALYLFSAFSKRSYLRNRNAESKAEGAQIFEDFQRLLTLADKRSISWTYAMIHSIYGLKIALDHASPETTQYWRAINYIHHFFISTQSSGKAIKMVFSLLSSIIEYRKNDSFIEAFARFVEESWTTDVFQAYTAAMQLCHQLRIMMRTGLPNEKGDTMDYVDVDQIPIILQMVVKDLPPSKAVQFQSLAKRISKSVPTEGKRRTASDRRRVEIHTLQLILGHIINCLHEDYKLYLYGLFEASTTNFSSMMTYEQFWECLEQVDPALLENADLLWDTAISLSGFLEEEVIDPSTFTLVLWNNEIVRQRFLNPSSPENIKSEANVSTELSKEQNLKLVGCVR